ncbi:hypothetical protein CPB83DRAFT_838312 [Crepidotus variabilis]|uniref:Uncharacterized protein n=1 Tax=Crepidotus variabilis TaxID=179855 RepID=A0A9P6E9Y4_9AGAR|nr:hypothetical protein CPB83DRAFT_838312 [Crepidotus variabilis]
MANKQIYYQVFVKGNSIIDVKKPVDDNDPTIGRLQTSPPLNAGKVKREIVKQEGYPFDPTTALYLVAGDDAPAKDDQIIEGQYGADQEHPIAVVFKGDPTA